MEIAPQFKREERDLLKACIGVIKTSVCARGHKFLGSDNGATTTDDDDVKGFALLL
jgi:hypothetical protein